MSHLAVPGFIGLPQPWPIVVIAAIAVVAILWITALVRAISGVVRSGSATGVKALWIAVIMSLQPVGVVLWFAGRRRS